MSDVQLIQGLDLAWFLKHMVVKRPYIATSIDERDTRISFDISAGDAFWKEKDQPSCQRVYELAYQGTREHFEQKEFPESGVTLKPGEFIILDSQEYFKMPEKVFGVLNLRSWAALAGLSQTASLLIKPNWEGHLKMELSNSLKHHDLLIPKHASIAHIQFFSFH